MSPTDAYQAGGWPAVAILMAAAVIVYLVRDNRELRARIDDIIDTERTMLAKMQERDADELREFRRQRDGPGH